jgi:methionine aminotransferase
MGYVLAPENLMQEFRKVHQFNVFSCNHPLQLALADYMSDEDNYLGLSAFYDEKRTMFLEMVSASRFKASPSKGTYFQLLNYSEISSLSDVDMAKKLVVDHKLASIPISVFYHANLDEHFLRFCFAKKEETLKRAGDILINL